jgi:hypothetical protein
MSNNINNFNNNNNNKINNNISNNNNLGPSLAQGQVFRKQQQTRILTNNDVVTGNTAREQNKNIVSKQKNGKVTMANIEPFSQKNALNGNSSSDNYAPVSKMEIARDEERIKKTNQTEKAKTKNTISSYSQLSKNLNKFQQGITDEVTTYNHININPSLLNRNYSTADSKTIRVNNAGVVNTLDPTSVPSIPPLTPGINITTSIAKSPSGINYVPLENIPSGSSSGPDTGLYNPQTSANPIKMPQGISAYNLEGKNVYVLYPYPNDVASINQNMVYYGVYTNASLTGLTKDIVISPNTTLKCIQRAIDKGYTACGMTNYSGGSGDSMVGNITLDYSTLKYAYKLQSVSTDALTTTKFEGGKNILTFAADGVLYAGRSGNLYETALTTTISKELHPYYGGTINNLVASYAYNQGNWQNLQGFSGNSDLTGQPSGTFNTLYQHDVQVSNTAYRTEYDYDWFWGYEKREVPYTYYTTQTETKVAAPNTEGGNSVYINYNCGNTPIATPINETGVNAGQGFNVDCSELSSQYSSFTLTLSDSGTITISNSSSSTPDITINIPFGYPTSATLSNGQNIMLNLPRIDDWVNGDGCINKGGGPLKSASMTTPSMQGDGDEWISSPNGYCRLILTRGTLQLQYSLQDITLDSDNNPIGNGSSIALYIIENTYTSNLGSSAHIDINGVLNPYTQDMIEYDNSYIEMQNYIPNPNILNQSNSNIVQNAKDEQCRIACNNDSTCAGYIVYGNCNLLKAGDIFPTGGDRIPNSKFSTYIRNHKFPQNNKSCRKTLDAVIDSEAYSYYLGNGVTPSPPNNMKATTKCNLGKIIENQMIELEFKNLQAIAKGKEVKGQIQDLFDRKNKVLNRISDNRTIAQFYDDYTKKTTDKIQDIENSQITKSAAEKDSELLLISDNYRYVIWGIVSLLLSIAAIKGMRMASS